MYLVCISEHTTHPEGDKTSYKRWVGDGLGHETFDTAEEANAVRRHLLAMEWRRVAEHVGTTSPPHWIDTQEDEFTYTNHMGVHNVAGQVFALEAT